MRLLNITTLRLETFYSDIPSYAILSHVWGNEEVSFQDLETGAYQVKRRGWEKIVESSRLAAEYGCNYVWIDTCCIDKTSSAELSEAINSMFRWYRKSQVCFAYLEDVSSRPDVEEDKARKIVDDPTTSVEQKATPLTPLKSSRRLLSNPRWFSRGWTLQELIAPHLVYFYDSSWNNLGDKRQLEEVISKTTGIDSDVLLEPSLLYSKSIARRMSWASDRETTRVEDIAYCLMGIF
jgi:hypothetical protein